ncbi:MAG: hypothetical protein K6A91_06870 [Clostridia bacterium]|nr:hypothetical protein [Clostridia bacterium]
MSRIHISYNAFPELTDSLAEEGHQICFSGRKQAVSEPISSHPDIYMCKLGTSPKSPVFKGNADLLGPEYPSDVLYNAVVTEKFLICNTSTVSQDLMQAVKDLYPDIRMINVAQGYTKCNVVVVDDSHFITEDEGIYKALCASDGPECLLISAGHVELPGYKRGFIGGTSGRIGDEIWFNGDLNAHPDAEKIVNFICGCDLTVSWISDRPLVDIGSIIEETI